MKIFLIGFMGCGKSHWGRELSRKLKVPLFDLDEQIVASEGKDIVQIFADHREEHFRRTEKEVLHIISESHESFVMACGGGTPCFYNNIGYMNSKGTTVWIHCSIDCLYGRLMGEKEKRPLLRSLTDAQLKSYVIKKFSDRKIFYEQASVTVTDDHLTLDKLVNAVFHH